MNQQRQRQKSKAKNAETHERVHADNHDIGVGEVDDIVIAVIDEYVTERPGLQVEDIDERDINAIIREISAREPALSHEHSELYRKVDINLRRRIRAEVEESTME